jgi:hypothetical protein
MSSVGTRATPGGLLFVLEDRPAHRTAQLHVVPQGGENWRQYLAFRDRLRIDSDARAAYAEVKRSLGELGAGDRQSYTAGKPPSSLDCCRWTSCRAPSRRLPTRQVVTVAGPHPSGRAGDRRRQASSSVILAARAVPVPNMGPCWGRKPSKISGQQRTATHNNSLGQPACRLVARPPGPRSQSKSHTIESYCTHQSDATETGEEGRACDWRALIIRCPDAYEPRSSSSHAWTAMWTSSDLPTTNTVAGSSSTSAVFVMRAIKRPPTPSTEARMTSKPNRVGLESFTAPW